MGLVQQEPTLFGGLSIRDNIAYSMDSHNNGMAYDEEEREALIIEACRKANAYDFIHAWETGLDTTVGERGVKLSGGQKQRIAIARAILLAPKVLLFDEATSALDSESEFQVQQAIDAASEGRTVVIVAHRLSSVHKSDQIVVLGEDNRIEDVGKHEELMLRSPTYQNLVSRQSSFSGKA
eukprot:CAMPEP_0172447874 /NCGR_PEP_ID=MMETSP1065-20121228/7044_1 /TAXON_ID=265537 /ORGANISM="Amphiprora paludosa, Strain CCMP125" /LENGTH=179 /DNA_ID=CAMNT_0013199245 /DNA_START=111 /DNA_END=650 /DNA_ORIENTATION=-